MKDEQSPYPRRIAVEPPKPTPRWLNWLAIAFTAALALAILYPVLMPGQLTYHGPTVTSDLKQLGLGLQMYVGDFDDRLPLDDSWMDATFPYIKNNAIYCDPAIPSENGKPPEGTFGFAFFEPLCGMGTVEPSTPEEVPMVFQSTRVQWNATAGLETLPMPPRKTPRADNGMNHVCFMDTHVRAFGPEWPNGPFVLQIENSDKP